MTTMIAVLRLFRFVLVGCLLPLLGRTRRGVLFGVTVSLEFAESAEARAALRRYRVRVAVLAVGVVMVVLAVLLAGKTWVLPLLVPVELFGALLLLQMERQGMKVHAVTVPLVRSTELLPQRHLGGIYASLTALLPLALEALWLRAHWDMLPASWPQHWDAYGHVNGWGTRSVAGVYGPLVLGAYFVLFMTATAAFIAFASGPQSKQRRMAVAPLAGLTWLMAGMFCVTGFLPLRHSFTPQAIALAVALYLLAMAAVVVWLIWRGGMIDKSKSAEPYDGTPDAMWRAGGLIYYNPSDAAVIVPKRYGLGWTLNFARTAAWCYLGGVMVMVALSTIVPFLLRK